MTEDRKKTTDPDYVLIAEFGVIEKAEGLRLEVEKCGYKAYTHFLTLENMEQVLKDIKSNCDDLNETIFLNLCDGTEDGEGGDGYPGLSLVKLLKDLGLNYTGSDASFYECSTSKVLLKKAMLAQNVSTSAYVEIHKETLEKDVINAIEAVGFPLFVKLTIS